MYFFHFISHSVLLLFHQPLSTSSFRQPLCTFMSSPVLCYFMSHQPVRTFSFCYLFPNPYTFTITVSVRFHCLSRNVTLGKAVVQAQSLAAVMSGRPAAPELPTPVLFLIWVFVFGWEECRHSNSHQLLPQQYPPNASENRTHVVFRTTVQYILQSLGYLRETNIFARL